MSFAEYELSDTGGSPFNLYLIRYGSAPNSYIAYTDLDEEVVFNSITYLPIPISRQAINASGSLDKTDLEITTPSNSELANLFRAYPPSNVVNLTIYQGHFLDPDQQFLVSWTGRVLSCALNVNEARFVCEPAYTSLRRPGLRRNYQYGCPLVLYGELCKASKVNATYNATVASAAGSLISLNPGWSPIPNEKFLGGILEWTNLEGDLEIRSILRNPVLDTFLVSGTLFDLIPGYSVRLILGCQRTMDDCLNLHNNIHNFGGHPFIPGKNPIGGDNPFY